MLKGKAMLSFSTGHVRVFLDMYPVRPAHPRTTNYSEREETAARLAIASYYQEPIDPADIVKRYCLLSGKEYSKATHDALWCEILTILPTWRYPGPDQIIFMAEFGTCQGTAYQDPPFLQQLEGVVDGCLLAAIKAYVEDAEDCKIRLTGLEAENESYNQLFDQASKIMDRPDGRPSQRYADAARIIGLSSGVRRKLVDDRDLFKDYLMFTKWHGQRRIDALGSVIRKHDLGGTRDALVARLYGYRAKHIYAFYDEKYPAIASQIRVLMGGLFLSRDKVK